MTQPAFPAVALSVVMPAYNEAANITATVERAVASLARQVGQFELILIDDASTDDTPRLADDLAVRHPEVTVVHNPVNLRQGGCLKKGFALARFEYVTHNAMDYPFDFDDLPLLLHELPADIVVASRRSYPGISRGRLFVSFVNRWILRLTFGVRIRDFNFVQIYRKAVIDEQPSFSDATSFITAEKIIRASRAGNRVVEVEVPYHPRLAGRPSSATVPNIRQALRDIVALRRELWREERRAVR